MTKGEVSNIAASVRQRLLNIIRETGDDANLVWTRYATEIPQESPLALTEEFGSDATKSIQWKGFVRKSGLEQGVPEFLDVLSNLREFLLPVLNAASGAAPIPKSWSAGGSWVYTRSGMGEI